MNPTPPSPDDQGALDPDRAGHPLDEALRSTMAAHMDGVVATNETWAAISRSGSARRSRRSVSRRGVIALITAAAVLAAVLVVRVNGSGPGKEGDSVTAATQPEAVAATINGAITDVTKAGLVLAAALEREQLTSVEGLIVAGAPNAEERLRADRSATDAAILDWTTVVDGASIPSMSVTDAIKQGKNRLSQVDEVRRSVDASTNPSASMPWKKYADAYFDVLSVNRAVLQSSTSVTQVRALQSVQSLTTISSGTTQLAVTAMPELAGTDGANSNALFAEVKKQHAAIVRAAGQYSAQRSLDAKGKPVPLPGATLTWDASVQHLLENHDGQAFTPIAPTEWLTAARQWTDAHDERALAVVQAIPANPPADRAPMPDAVRALIDASWSLTVALDDEALSTAGVRTGLRPVAELTRSRDATDEAVNAWRTASGAELPTNDGRPRLAIERLEQRIVILSAIRVSSDKQEDDPPGIADQYVDLSADVSALQDALIWLSGSVVELRRQFVVLHLASAASHDAALAGYALSAGPNRLAPNDLQVFTTRAADRDFAEDSFDALATGTEKQQKRDADLHSAALDQAVRELLLAATTVPVASIYESATSWVAALHRVGATIRGEVIDATLIPAPRPPGSTFTGTATAVAPSEGPATTTAPAAGTPSS
jgi:hypothetical protein